METILLQQPGGPIPHNMARALMPHQVSPRNSKAVPSRTIWRRPLMVRQPYSVAVLSTGGRLHPLVPEEREAW